LQEGLDVLRVALLRRDVELALLLAELEDGVDALLFQVGVEVLAGEREHPRLDRRAEDVGSGLAERQLEGAHRILFRPGRTVERLAAAGPDEPQVGEAVARDRVLALAERAVEDLDRGLGSRRHAKGVGPEEEVVGEERTSGEEECSGEHAAGHASHSASVP
jgi:hypothetical protein